MRFLLRALCCAASALAVKALAGESSHINQDRKAAAPGGVLPLHACGLAFMPKPQVTARRTGPSSIEVVLQSAAGRVRFELRFDCGNTSFEQLAADAGFLRQGGNWAQSGAGAAARAIRTRTWRGVAGNTLQGGVCRSVVGQAPERGTSFFADFCVSEADYARFRAQFDATEKQLVLLGPGS
jgi:hypothetical protein